MWSAPIRCWHGFGHLREGLELINRFHSYLADPHAVKLAWWLHDVVYDPLAKDNEQQSVNYAWALHSEKFFAQRIEQRIGQLIWKTAHFDNSDMDCYDKFDGDFIHDIDLFRLGAHPDDWQRYNAQIRCEYPTVSDEDYKKGRLKALQGLIVGGNPILSSPTVYRTTLIGELPVIDATIYRTPLIGELPVVNALLTREQQAVDNLSQSIKELC